MYEHLLVALDGSETAEQVLGHTEALAGAFGSTVTLLTAIVSLETIVAETAAPGPGAGDLAPPIDPTPIVEAERASSAEYLAGVAARLRQKNISVDVETPEGNAADVIVERAQALGVSLILMTTHGRSGLGRLVFGSTADSVLRHAASPVLLVRVHE
jgi:nucleotide-binding universal stress UspA family protein